MESFVIIKVDRNQKKELIDNFMKFKWISSSYIFYLLILLILSFWQSKICLEHFQEI